MVVILTLFSNSVIRWQSCAQNIVVRQDRSLLSPKEILDRHIAVQELSRRCQMAEVQTSGLGYWDFYVFLSARDITDSL
jgi:hypothetical protein